MSPPATTDAPPAGSWLADERTRAATDRILDAAGTCFATVGVGATNMADVAAAAGCSRATVYRYFASRDDLRRAFVQRAAARLGASLAADLGSVADPAARVVTGVTAALGAVRRDPALAPWFATGEAAGVELGLGSDAVTEVAVAFTAALSPTPAAAGTEPDATVDLDDRAGWLVRVIVSLLSSPGRDADHERRLIERFVVPVVIADVEPP